MLELSVLVNICYLQTLLEERSGTFRDSFLEELKLVSWLHVDLVIVTKLDQETWLCRTHLDDFLVKIWTNLYHKRTRLNLVIKAILLNLWSISFRPFMTILDH